MGNIYSYHTFLFPFIIEKLDGKSVSLQESADAIKKFDWDEVIYSNDNLDILEEIMNQRELLNMESPSLMQTKALNYSSQQYFLNAAKNVIYGDTEVSKVFRFNKVNEEITVKIQKGKDEIYELKLCNIILNIYNTGGAVLRFELANNKSRDIQSITRINEFGRRVYPPYVDKDNGGCALVADKIEIKNKNNKSVLESKYNGVDENKTVLTEIILKILGDKFSLGKEEGKLRCKHILDDRMFVLCAVDDEDMIKSLAKWNEKKQMYKWEEECLEWHYSQQRLYEFVFIDGDGISCIDRVMRYNILKEHLNTRWLGYMGAGTLYGITQHSMVMLTAGKFIIPNFINMYTEMAVLVVAQRMSIIALANKAANIGKAIKKEQVKEEECQQIIELQKEYVYMENELLSFEITAQEQGIELYKALQKFLFIEEENTRLEQQIHNLFEIAQMYRADNTNNVVEKLTWITIFMGVIQIVQSAFGSINLDIGVKFWIVISKVICIIVQLGIYWWLYKQFMEYKGVKWNGK